VSVRSMVEMLRAHSWAAVASFAVLAVVFIPLERVFPARPRQRVLRPAFLLDVAFFVGQYLVWISLWLSVLATIDDVIAAPLQGLRQSFSTLPFALQALVVVLGGDLCVYWFHRACHANPLLWRIHSVHHSAQHLDWLAAHREHPLDGLLTQIAVNAPALVLGFSVGQIAWLAALRGMWAIFIHSNVRLPLGPLRLLLGAPEVHHFHHLRSERTVNFANVAPWTDLLFGTYHCPDGPEEWPLGVEDSPGGGYWGMLLRPLRPRRRPAPNP
jgi:sterol desaturase/sphingolipid hydroxylase (fatty acid hydroxylase superfamily)